MGQERIKMAIIQSNECMSIINNKLLSRKRIVAGKDLLQKVIIPTLTFGAETWGKLTEIEHIANTRKLQYYIDLQNRDENKLEVQMQKLQQSKYMSYEREINQLKEKYKIEICLKGKKSNKDKKVYKNEIPC